MTAASLPEVAYRQGGVFTRAQAFDAGFSRRQVDHRVSRGHWYVICGTAMAARSTPPDAHTRAWAVHLTWPFAVTSHLTAAELYGFPVPSSPTAHVTVHDLRHSIRGVTVHRTPLSRDDVVRSGSGPALTRRVRTGLDCLRALPLEDALRLFAWLATRAIVTRERLAEEVAATPGRWGTPQLVRVLAKTAGDALSEAEILLHKGLRAHGVTGWRANVPVVVDGRAIAVVDLLFAAAKVVVEVDGYGTHSSRQAFVHDRRRQNELIEAGYVVLRFTWADLTERLPEVIAQIVAVVMARS